MPEKCHVIGCAKPVVAKGLCGMHRQRMIRHGALGQTRPADWGDREKHPAYGNWCSLRRYKRAQLPATWLTDFWTFVREVPPRPEGHVTARRSNETEPFSSNNFYWATPRTTVSHREDRAAYMREWHRLARQADPNYGRDKWFKRHYGIDLAWYEAQHTKQGGVCAICREPETALIKGRLIQLSVDHCHEEGHVRGLLCMVCNRGLGFFKHDPERLQGAIEYLARATSKLI